MKKIAVFASGNGSNFQALVDAVKAGNLRAKVCLLVSDNKSAYVVERAANEHIESFCFSPKEYREKADFETKILQQLQRREVEFIILAGYMRLIGPTILREYPGKIINIHPSLLPAFPGKDAIGQAFNAGVKKTGVTIHFVDEGMDTGPIIAQKEVEIMPYDTKETMQQRIQQAEYETYPKVLEKLFLK